jgi:hypothetical protein
MEFRYEVFYQGRLAPSLHAVHLSTIRMKSKCAPP